MRAPRRSHEADGVPGEGAPALRLGIDLGGTKTEIIALSPEGAELLRRRRPTAPSYAGTLDLIEALVREAEEELGARGSLGVGIPGALHPATARVRNANSTWLIGHPLGADLERRLGRRVRIMNDANCFALSEAVDGAGAGAAVVFGVILGTGVGGGIVVDGRILVGAQRIAGEWGHNPLPRGDGDPDVLPPCYCGRLGCVETFLSGPGLALDHQRATGTRREPPDIVRAAGEGDAQAAATIERYVNRLARALGVVINVVDPDVIVLGGGMSHLPGLAERVQAALPPYVFADDVTTRVRTNVHGDSSGVRGAAWLWGGPPTS